jgi:hypothetical protein
VRIFFIGDVFGKPGRRLLKERLAAFRAAHDVEIVIANGENAAEGFGVNAGILDELCNAGVDVVTMGDHLWDKREIAAPLATDPRILRPANYPEGAPGRGTTVLTAPSGNKLAVLNLQGRVFMYKQTLDDPFRAAKAQAARLRAETPIVIVDFHAEATSEKVAMGWWLDGEVSAVFGTHTHVQTADDRILPKGTAYLSDAGMTGPADGVIGLDRDRVLERFLRQVPSPWGPATGRVQLCGVLVDADEKTGQASAVTRVWEMFEPAPPASPASTALPAQ